MVWNDSLFYFPIYETPPSLWFFVVQIAARYDVTKHTAIFKLPLYRVLAYADALLRRSSVGAEEDNPESYGYDVTSET